MGDILNIKTRKHDQPSKKKIVWFAISRPIVTLIILAILGGATIYLVMVMMRGVG